MTVHTKIKQLRLARGWSRRQLAEEIQKLENSATPISTPTIGGWEDGSYAPKRLRLPFVAQALGTTVEALRDDAPGEPAGLRATERGADYIAQAGWPFRHITHVEVKRLSDDGLEQLERIMGATLGVEVPTVSWRPTALRLAADLDRARGNDEFTMFVRALDLELERERAKLQPARKPTAKAST